MRKKERFLDDSLINLTPLIDVIFVVLIAFIIIAPLLESENIDLAQSGKKTIKKMSQSHIKIYVKKDNSIWIDNKRVNVKTLKRILSEKKRIFPKDKIQLYHDKKAFFGTYYDVKNIAEKSGFERLDVILKR
jgi:biopolymer transport protein ExbD